MATIYRSLVTALLLLCGYALFTGAAVAADPASLAWHLRVGLVVTLLGSAVHCVAFAYFIGTSYWVKTFVLASGASADWVVRQRAWIRGRAFPALYAAALLPAAAAITGNLVDTGRAAALWHPALVVAALAGHIVALWLVPPAMRRNAQVMDELAAAHRVPQPGSAEAHEKEEREADEALPPLFQLSRVLLYSAINAMVVWLYLRFGTESFRGAPLWPFVSAFGVLLTVGLALNARHDPGAPASSGRAWGRALAVGAGSCALLSWALGQLS